MNNPSLELKALGWSDWFGQRAECGPAETVARVAAVDRDRWLLVDPAGPFPAKPSGSYLHRHFLPEELPCVGDWVCLKRQPGDEFGVIQSVVERRTFLRRKAAGTAGEYQMIAANVDWVVIVASCHLDFNLKRLERYLVTVADGGAEPCILLTKTDLVDPAVPLAQVAQLRAAGIVAPIMTLSNLTRDGLEDFARQLSPGNTYCFVGSSGVGKSTLINRLVGGAVLETGAVSGTGEGRHTTVRRELILLEGGALLIDNPGMRELGVSGALGGVEGSYSDIAALAADCRYRDCSHTGEPGCAVRGALQSGELSPEHYDNYLKLRSESRFCNMSHAEKRKKDRDFGRYLKSVKKDLGNCPGTPGCTKRVDNRGSVRV